MAYFKKIGVFLDSPTARPGAGAMVPPLSGGQIENLYLAFAKDLLVRIERIKKCAGTVFYPGDYPEMLEPFIPRHYSLAPQEGATPGERLQAAFKTLLREERDCAVIIGTGSPDIPLQYIKRAFIKLKHKDMVLGPTTGGGQYLTGLKSPPPVLFPDPPGEEDTMLLSMLEIVERNNLALSLLPLWYAVDDSDRLSLLRTMMHARVLEKSGRLMHTESELERIFGTVEK